MIDPDKLKRTAKAQDIFSSSQLRAALQRAGLKTSRSQAARLWEGNVDARHTTMEALCKALKCEEMEISKRVGRRR